VWNQRLARRTILASAELLVCIHAVRLILGVKLVSKLHCQLPELVIQLCLRVVATGRLTCSADRWQRSRVLPQNNPHVYQLCRRRLSYSARTRRSSGIPPCVHSLLFVEFQARIVESEICVLVAML